MRPRILGVLADVKCDLGFAVHKCLLGLEGEFPIHPAWGNHAPVSLDHHARDIFPDIFFWGKFSSLTNIEELLHRPGGDLPIGMESDAAAFQYKCAVVTAERFATLHHVADDSETFVLDLDTNVLLVLNVRYFVYLSFESWIL